jgi:hypothetical protein
MAVPNFPAIVTIYELDNPKITGTVTVRNGNIIDIDPVLRVFIGKTLNDLAKWLERHGKTTLTAVSSKSDTRKERNPYE